MSLFRCERPSVCEKCGVHFAPRQDKYPRLCLPHAEPHLDLDRRQSRVMDWALMNWTKLEEQANKEFAESEKAQREAMQKLYATQALGHGTTGRSLWTAMK